MVKLVFKITRSIKKPVFQILPEFWSHSGKSMKMVRKAAQSILKWIISLLVISFLQGVTAFPNVVSVY